MAPYVLTLETSSFFLMRLLADSQATGLLFCLRHEHQFVLLPYFPGQGLVRGEHELHDLDELVAALWELIAAGWEVVGRVALDYRTVRAHPELWRELLGLLSPRQPAEPAAAPEAERAG